MTDAALVAAVERVPRSVLARVFWRSLFLQAAWNPRGMQDLGFAYAMGPALEALYPDPGLRARAAERHLELFNCHPYLAEAILGGALHLEERVAAGAATPASVSAFKRALGPPFAALGDGFFWLALRPVCALAAAATAPWLGPWCVAVFLLLYNSVHLTARAWLFLAGYTAGEGVVKEVGRAHLAAGTTLLKATGAVLAGAIAGRAVALAGLPDLPARALLAATLVALATVLLPRVQPTRAVYFALFAGLALALGFL